jgi:ABC-2 type transport system permease protein
MTLALVYLQTMVIRNAVAQRVRRLRQPRYMMATLLGLAYFYFLFFRRSSFQDTGPGAPVAPVNIGLLVGVSMAAVIMTGRIIYSWIFSADRAALSFTEAEVAFLFQAPVQRRVLVHYKLLKSQIRILFSAALFALVSRRLGFLGGNGWMHAIGWWILLSTLELHSIAASFTRERLLEVGLNPARRRALFLGGLLLVGGALWWWLRRTIPAPRAADMAGPMAMVNYFQGVLTAPPVSWLLAPCIWILRPFFAPDLAAFIRALGPALLILAGHYLWVIRSEVAFEEASLELARRRAERGEARQAGHWRERSQPRRKRREPFPLRPHGMAAPAFLWRALISAGPWFYPRNWLFISAGVLGAMLWLASQPAHRTAMVVIQAVALPVGFWVLIAGPMLMRREVRLMMQRLDVVKTYPLRGWQVVLGEMLAPIVLITAIEWLLLAVLAVAAAALNGEIGFIVLSSGLGVVGVGLLVPSVVGLMTGIPFAATLYFPSWMSAVGQAGGGLDAMGQRMMFAGGYVVVLAAALLPAALVAAGPYLIVLWMAGAQAAALAAAAVAASLILFGELAAVVWWLGGRYERFDLSEEAPQS